VSQVLAFLGLDTGLLPEVAVLAQDLIPTDWAD